MMHLSPDDRIILDRLLSQLASRLNGAIDFWTVVCLGDLPGRREFLAHQEEIMHSLVIVLGELFKGTGWAQAQPVRNLFETLSKASERVQNAFLILEQFHTVPLAEVRRATQELVEGHNQFREAIRQLGQTANVSISYWQGWTAEREEYTQRVLHGLFDYFCHARGAEQPGIEASSSSGG